MSATAAVQLFLRRLAEVDRPEVWISLRDEATLSTEAASVEGRVAAGERLPLAGLLFAVKDNIDVAGLPTTAAAASYSYDPERDAVSVARLRAAGAIVVGKTNMDQFATGLVGTRSPYGAVRNAWDPTRISGGSSSGSGVAVALGLVDFALGTDTAGSGRVPAALNGIVGVKPTVGIVPTQGVVPACKSLDCVTVFARDLDLASEVLSLMAGPGPDAPNARRTHRVEVAGPIPRLGIPTAEHLEGLAPGWREAFYAAADQWRARGVEVVEVDVTPLLDAAKLLYEGAFVAERYTAVGEHIEANRDQIGADLDPTVSGIILAGGNPPAWRLFADMESRDALGREGKASLAGVDALLTPTTTWHPTLEEVAADPVGANSKMGRYTNFCNLLDYAAIAVPAGMVTGLPFGIMLTAPAGSDAMLASLAKRFQAPELEIAVFGAHLTGQPLNHQLIAAGGSLVGAVSTASTYKLFALDTVPPKPGLVRVADGGVSIEGELWRLPASGFGTFVASLPAPMAIGKVELSDGRVVTGFQVEPIAVAGAEDISFHGGWRGYLKR